MKSRIWINNHTGQVVPECYPNSSEYIRMDIVRWAVTKYRAEHNINKTLREKLNEKNTNQ